MTLEPIELHDLFNSDIAYEHDYARIRVGKLRAILDYQRRLEEEVEKLEAKKKELESSLSGSRDVCDAYRQKYSDSKEMELIRRKRATDAENKLAMYEDIKLDIQG